MSKVLPIGGSGVIGSYIVKQVLDLRYGVDVVAGNFVTKYVEPWSVVGGNPTKFIKKRELRGSYAIEDAAIIVKGFVV